jgi:hypothetical protein
MLTFLEYYKGDKYLRATISNGKDINSFDRKHINTKPKKYIHKSSIVDTATNTPRLVVGNVLQKLLADYNTEFAKDTVKVLGNSDVEIEMFIDANGQMCGKVRKRI